MKQSHDTEKKAGEKFLCGIPYLIHRQHGEQLGKKYEKTQAMGKEYSGIKLVRVLFISPTLKVASLHL